MKTYSVSYDLSKPGQNYAGLIETIKSFDDWAHVLQSTWLVRSSLPASTVRDRLSVNLDLNDKLLVIEVRSSWASHGLSDRLNEWLLDRVAA